MKDLGEDFADMLGRFLMRAGLDQQDLADKVGVHRNTLGKWLRRDSQPQSRGQVLRLADELTLSKEERKALIQAIGFSVERWPTEIWTVPQPPNMWFTGRDDLLQALHQLLVPGSVMALTQAISGLGGIGKTCTAVEYACRFNQYYEAILWLQADSWEVLISECMKLAVELGLPEHKEADKIVAEVQRWLRKHRHWLLILDNIENPQEILSKFVPPGHQGSVLVTTRIHAIEPLAETQILSTMSESEGILFLLRRTKKLLPLAELKEAKMEWYHEARQIWLEMDGLPLALDQAGAYILETSCSFADYREQYIHRRAELLRRRGKRFVGHEASVTTTFSLAFEKVVALNPMAADILRICSLLNSEHIPEQFFQDGAQHLGPHLMSLREGWDLALGVLQDYSLVQRYTEMKTLSVHRLVQAVLQDTMSASDQEKWINLVMVALVSTFPDSKHETWGQCARLLPHALACVALAQSHKYENIDLASLLVKIGRYIFDQGRYIEVEPLYQQALSIQERVLGQEHPEVANVIYHLAILYLEQGKYTQAEAFQRRFLHFGELSGSYVNPFAINELALLYSARGLYPQAEQLCRLSCSLLETKQGPEHPKLARLINNLAGICAEQGKYADAEPLFRRALQIRESALGSGHPDVAESLFSMAMLYYQQDEYGKAEPLYQQARHIQEQALGPEHPTLALTLFGLANLYHKQDALTHLEGVDQEDQGKGAEAERLYLQTLHIQERALGQEHPAFARSLAGLANYYFARDKKTEAEQLCRQALDLLERALGPEHPDVAFLLDNLALLYLREGKHKQAEPLCQRSLAILKRKLGPNHPDTRKAESIYELIRMFARNNPQN